MKRSIKAFALALSLIVMAFASLVGCAKDDGKSFVVPYEDGMAYSKTVKDAPIEYYAKSYDVMGGAEVMLIGGFYSPYASGGSDNGNDSPNFVSDEIFSALADCGINMLVYSIDRYGSTADASIERSLELGEKYGIGYFVDTYFVLNQLGTRTEDIPLDKMPLSTESGKKQLSGIVETLSKNGTRKSFLGLMATDEPFPKQLDNIALYMNAFYGLENTSGLDVYMNCIGRWEGTHNFWSTENPTYYDDYLKMLLDDCGLQMFSNTLYPFESADGITDVNLTQLCDLLGDYRKTADKYKIPQWRMLQAGGQFNDEQEWKDSVDPFPSEGELLFDVNVSLAYGCKAIQYFPLIQPLHFAYQTGGTYDFTNRNGLIGADGNLTRWYYYAKRANTQIKAIDEYLMHAANMGVIVHGDEARRLIVENSKVDSGAVIGNSFRQLTRVSGDDCVVGCFDYLGGTAFYVVNFSRTEKCDVTLAFDRNDYRYKVIQRAEECDVVGGKMNLTLDAGEGALIVLS